MHSNTGISNLSCARRTLRSNTQTRSARLIGQAQCLITSDTHLTPLHTSERLHTHTHTHTHTHVHRELLARLTLLYPLTHPSPHYIQQSVSTHTHTHTHTHTCACMHSH